MKMNLGMKLIVVCLALSLGPLAVIASYTYSTASNEFDGLSSEGKDALEERAFAQLDAASTAKKGRIDDYFAQRDADMVTLTESTLSISDRAFDKMEAVGTTRAASIEDYYNEQIADAEGMAQTIDFTMNAAFTKMSLNRDLRGDLVERYIAGLVRDTETISDEFSDYIYDIYQDFFQYHEDTNVTPTGTYDVSTGAYQTIYNDNYNWFKDFTEHSGFSDMYLVCWPHGHVTFSVEGDSDLGQNVGSGSLSDSVLADAWSNAKDAGKGNVYISPVEYYEPKDDYAFMISAPLYNNDTGYAVLVIEAGLDELNSIVQDRNGMLASEETYIVAKEGAQSFLVTDPVIKDEDTGDSKSGSGITAALGGTSGTRTMIGSTGEVELEAYAPLTVQDSQWVIIQTVSMEDVMTMTTDEGNALDIQKEIFGYDDIYLIYKDGRVFYSVEHNADYQTNLLTGTYADTKLGEAFQEATDTEETAYTSIEMYEVTDTHVFFVVTPVMLDGNMELAVGIQVPNTEAEAVMTDTTGLGTTGRSYIVSLDDKTPRTSLRGVNEDVIRNSQYAMDTLATRTASNTVQNAIYQNYEGTYVLGVFKKMNNNLNWAVITEIDAIEVLVPQTENGNYYSIFEQEYGYYDVFLVTADGYILYTVEQDSEYQTNILTGKYRDSGLNDVISRSLDNPGETHASDFELYAASNAQAAFVGRGIERDGEAILAVAVQINTEQINDIMNEDTGMGDSGETYLVGTDKKMRSDSRFTAAVTSDIGVKLVDTVAVTEALAGRSGEGIITDYRGIRVLSSYQPFTAFDGDIRWALVAEIDESEAFAAAKHMEESGAAASSAMATTTVAAVVLAGVAATVVAFVFAQQITKPIIALVAASKRLAQGDFGVSLDIKSGNDEVGEMVNAYQDMLDNTAVPLQAMNATAQAIADGDLTKDIDISAKGEIEEMVKAFTRMQDNLRSLIMEIQDTSSSVASTSQELASSAEEMNASTEQVSGAIQQISRGSQDQATKVEDTAKIMEDMSGKVDDVSDRAESAAAAASQAKASSDRGREAIGQTVDKMETINQASAETTANIELLNRRSEEIGEIVEVIANITDQTNLLALNAAIEAARAGEQGRGFAVVAEEVKNLAEDSKEAAGRIAKMISQMQSETRSSVEQMKHSGTIVKEGMEAVRVTDATFQEILTAMDTMSIEVQEISASAQEQKAGTRSVVAAVDSIASVAEETASASEESASSTEELTASMEDMTARAQELSEMAMSLQRSAAQFRISEGDETESGLRQSRGVRPGTRRVLSAEAPKLPDKVKESLKKRGINVDQ